MALGWEQSENECVVTPKEWSVPNISAPQRCGHFVFSKHPPTLCQAEILLDEVSSKYNRIFSSRIFASNDPMFTPSTLTIEYQVSVKTLSLTGRLSHDVRATKPKPQAEKQRERKNKGGEEGRNTQKEKKKKMNKT
jgi:hypothetical protein